MHIMSAQRPPPFGLLMQMFTSNAEAAKEPPPNSTSVRSKFRRSRSARPVHLHPNIDGNTGPGRRFAEVALSLVGELGGEAALSEATRLQVRQAAALTM